MRRLGWLVLLLAVGALGIWLAAPDGATVRAALARVAAAPGATLAIVIGGALALVAAEAVRIVVIGRLLGAAIRIGVAIDAAVANQVLTAITPTIGLGEPSVAYILQRRGTALDLAVAVPFVKFATSLALVFALGAALVIAGGGPPVASALTAAAIALFAGIALVTAGFVAMCARPTTAERMVERVRGWLSRRRWLQAPARQARIERGAEVVRGAAARLATLRGTGWRGVAILGAVHLVYYVAYIAPLVGLALVLADPPLVPLLARALVYLCFMFAMPTPGGVGGAEAAAGVFFADLVPLPDAIAIVAVFRAATFYLQVGAGIVYVPVRAVVSA